MNRKIDGSSFQFLLNWLTNGMEEGVTFHIENSQRIYDLACDENMWEFWTEKEQSNFVKGPPLVNAINPGNWEIEKLKAIDRIVEYIHGHETDTLKRLLFYGFRRHKQTVLYKRKLYQRNDLERKQ